MAANRIAALFAVVPGVVFLSLGLIHLRARPTLIRGRTISLSALLVILYPLFILPIYNLLRGALLGEAYTWASVLGLVFFVVVALGFVWYFRGWVLFNIDTKSLAELIRDACRTAQVPLRPEDPARSGKGLKPLVFRLGEEGRELHLRREPGSRYASLFLTKEHDLPWLHRFATGLRRQAAELRTGRYYSRALIYLVIGLVCLGFAVILFRPELLGLAGESAPLPTTFYR